MQKHTPQDNIEMIGPSISKPDLRLKTGPSLQPTDEMRRAKAWIEEIHNPPVALTDLLAIHGWLTPAGELYACGWKKHDVLTAALGYAHESEIERAGFCKLSELRWLVEPRYCKSGPTPEQWGTIERWYERNRFPDEHFMRLTSPV